MQSKPRIRPIQESPDYTPEQQAMAREYARRVRMISQHLLPCPKCASQPAVDLGLLDDPYPPGYEYIHCPTYLIGIPGIPDQGCGCHATGAEAWNRRA